MLLSIDNVIGKVLTTLEKHWKPLLVITLFTSLAQFALSEFEFRFSLVQSLSGILPLYHPSFSTLPAILQPSFLAIALEVLFIYLISTIIYLGQTNYILESSRRNALSFSMLWSQLSTKNLLAYVIASFLRFMPWGIGTILLSSGSKNPIELALLVRALGIAPTFFETKSTALGFLGIVVTCIAAVILIRFMLISTCIIDKNMGPIKALKRSNDLVSGATIRTLILFVTAALLHHIPIVGSLLSGLIIVQTYEHLSTAKGSVWANGIEWVLTA